MRECDNELIGHYDDERGFASSISLIFFAGRNRKHFGVVGVEYPYRLYVVSHGGTNGLD